jgi:hypothetical protein
MRNGREKLVESQGSARYVSAPMFLQRPLLAFTALLIASGAAWLFADPTTQPSLAANTPTSNSIVPDEFKAVALLDDDDDDERPKTSTTPAPPRGPSRYFFGLLDSRSSYGKDFFPDPFLGPEFDRETQLELDYAHAEGHGRLTNEVDAEVEWNAIGELTLAAETGWVSEHQPFVHDGGEEDESGENGSGLESIDLAIYHPVFQYVSKNDQFDYTAAVRVDAAIPTGTPASGTELSLTPYFGQLLRIGDSFSIEAWTGGQFTVAPHQTNPFIYGASFGYRLSHNHAPLPFTTSLTPLFELDGQAPFSHRGQDALFAVAGFNWQLAPIGDLSPRLGLGYQFPIDEGGRDQLRLGLLAQLFVEF